MCVCMVRMCVDGGLGWDLRHRHQEHVILLSFYYLQLLETDVYPLPDSLSTTSTSQDSREDPTRLDHATI